MKGVFFSIKFIFAFIYIIILNGSIVFGQNRNSSLEFEDVIYQNNVKAFQFYNNALFDSAIFYYNKTTKLKEAYYGPMNFKVGIAYMNTATVYTDLYRYEETLDLYKKAVDIFTNDKENGNGLLLVAYVNLANVYYNIKDYGEAMRYYKYVEENAKVLFDYSVSIYLIFVSNYSELLISLGKNQEALDFVKKYMVSDSNQPLENEFLIYTTLASTNKSVKDYSEAQKYYELAYAKYPKVTPFYAPKVKSIFILSYTNFLITIKEYDKARGILLKELAQSTNDKSKNIVKNTDIYLLLCSIMYLTDDYINSYQFSGEIIEELDNYIITEVLEGNSNIFIYHPNMIEILHLRALSALEIFKNTQNIQNLKDSYDSYCRIIDILTKQKLGMRNVESIQVNGESLGNIYAEAIQVSAKLYELTNNLDYRHNTFKFLESSKSFSLVSEFTALNAMEFSGLPKDVKEKEKELTLDIKASNELLFNESAEAKPDSFKISNLKERLFFAKNQYNELISFIEKNYPNYYNLKYNLHFVEPEILQNKLSANQAFVEYSFNENELTVFLIDRNQITLFSQPIDSAFADECYEYYELLRNQSFINGIQSTYQRYQELSRKFYTVLMEPVLERTRKRHITIIPDGPLVYLPFETFLTEDVDPYYANYTKLPYLIYDASIGYGYSATLMYSQHPNKVKTKNKVLAFAPSYENLFTDTLQLVWNREANPDQLVDLQGIYKEVNAIKSIVRSDVYMEGEATETNFKENASKYAILHLAMHTILNDEDPMYSRLVFTRTGSDTLNDNDLYTYEVYNLDINAKMTVLSSCSSGFGKMLRGEGFLSLARGFIYAGCPSIIMTLWQAPDNSSPELMTSFYKHLKRGSNKIEALRKSKIEYLKESDGLWANPYFWSPFVVIGDSSPLYRRQDILYWSLLIGLFSIATSFTVIRIRRKRP